MRTDALIEHSRIRFARLNSGLATIRNLGLEGSFFANWQSTLAAKTLTLKVPTCGSALSNVRATTPYSTEGR